MSYYKDMPGEWRPLITARKRWSQGAHRWEAVNLNGWAIFNNGLDLPLTYRVGDKEAVPIWELREQGIASVGTIWEHSGIFMAADVREIQAAKLQELFRFQGIRPSGQITATQDGHVVTASESFFLPADCNAAGARWIVYADGTQREIGIYTHSKEVTAGGAAYTFTKPQTFEIRVKAAQAGALHSGLIYGAMVVGVTTVFASDDIFGAMDVGKWVWFRNGFHRKILNFVSATQVDLEGAPNCSWEIEPFFIVDDATDYTVIAGGEVFDSSMVGQNILWPNGETRKITEYVNATTVKVDRYVAVASGFIGIENAGTYAAYTDEQYVNRVGYKIIWGLPGLPRRWAATQLGTIAAGSRFLTLKYPMKSLEAGQQIVIAGAGLEGGNHITTIVYAYALGTKFMVSTAVNTSVVDAAVMRADAVGSIVGSYDLQDDGSPILRGKDCRGELVIYKDTAIFLGKYTGLVDQPFGFKRISIPNGSTLYYPWTLIEVQGLWHFYVGRNGFFKFDMTNQLPIRIPLTDLCDDLFFKRADPTRMNEIWTADNWITREVLLSFPSTANDKALWLDYAQETLSTTSGMYTAAGMVKRPFYEGSHDWFLMGNWQGTVLVYGKLDYAPEIWGTTEIFWRRGANPFSATLRDYLSTLQSGYSDLGDSYNEKDLRAVVVLLASHESTLAAVQITLEIIGARNVGEGVTLLASHLIAEPKAYNLVPMFFRQHFFSDRLKVSGPVPCRLSSRVWEIAGLKSKSAIRREV